jgi:hypothetical protein
MPNRILRDGINESEAVNSLSIEAEVFYRRLMSLVDDYGRCEANLKILLVRLFPLQQKRWSQAKIGAAIKECNATMVADGEPLVLKYESGGKDYLQISRFGQRIRGQSKFPAPEGEKTATEAEKCNVIGLGQTLAGQCHTLVSTPPQSADTGGPVSHTGGSRANTPPPTPPHSEVLSLEKKVPIQDLELVVAEPETIEPFEEILSCFKALGRGTSFEDRVTCENRWKGYSMPERLKAYVCARDSFPEWKTRPTDKIPYPVNWFSRNQWERHAPRLIPQEAERTRAMTASDEAKRRFREAR